MQLSEARQKYPKEMVYDTYIRICYSPKDYDDISRKEMINEIIKTYHQDNFLFAICTLKELSFIKKFYKNNLEKKDVIKYKWEINELDKKYIFNKETLSFYEDFDDIILVALEQYKNSKKDEIPLSVFVVAEARIQGEMLTSALCSLATSLYPIHEEDFDSYLGHPLIHFYCGFLSDDDFLNGEERIFFRDYYDYLDDLEEQRKELGIAGALKIDMDLFKDFYYYGCNYSNPSVKKMYDTLNKTILYPEYKLRCIDICRLLGIEYENKDDEMYDIISEALYEMPSGAMNGASPKEREEQLKKHEDLTKQFVCVQQINAHVHKEVVKKFYYYYFALLEYTNNKYKVNEKIKKIFKQEYLNPEDIVIIEDYFWKNKNIIDEFIKENPFSFTNNDFDYIKQFKSGLEEDLFVYVGTDKEYAKFLSENGKLYMVKGLNCNIDRILPNDSLPYMVKTHLMMFEDNIIFTGLISNFSVQFDNGFESYVLEELKKAITYYHL